MVRNLLLCAVTLVSIKGFAQSTVRYIDAQTKTPVCGIYANIFKNENTFQDCGGSDEQGYFSLNIENVDPSATYQFSFNDANYKPVWKEINIHSNDTLTVELTPDEYYMENTEDMYAKGCNSISLVYFQN